ncbi:PREDICTED: facilitated trehalose transporter Tret1-like [Eufriesea mexicana]|uniref:facilitated trehalose transporter Tret1-like n=1 Tax=Eufriesea mexicana TaxID=516756 RepID=UPI00083BD047|nr:PREDICTED: facilitated trehalose transporter Tret1-like [Eufriesea mexicana]
MRSEERNEKVEKKVLWPQWIAGFGVYLLTTQLGLMCGWSSPHVHLLTGPNAPFPVTMSEVSWVVSLLNYGRFFGAIAGAVNINYFGSKAAVLISGVPGTLCWLFVIVANNVNWLYSSRFFGGICVGMTYSCYSLYVGEIAEPSIRGALVALATCGIPSGTFLMSVMGAYLPMRISAAISLAICIVMIGIFVWLPESPHHLIKKNLEEKAKLSIQWYHRNSDVETEFVGLRRFVENLNKLTLKSALDELVQYRKPLFIISCLIIYSQWCGINTVLFYMETILTSAKVSVIPPATVVIIVMPCGMVASCLSMVLMDRYGRKPLMIASCIGITISFVMLTVEFHLLGLGYNSKSVEGVSFAAMILFYMSVSLGAILVPQTVLGEVFAPHLKWLAACIISSIAAIAAIVSASTYLPLLNAMTERYLFLFFGVIIATAVPFTIFCVPETKGLSLQEIQKKFGGKSTPRVTSVYMETDKLSRGKIAGPFIILPSD